MIFTAGSPVTLRQTEPGPAARVDSGCWSRFCLSERHRRTSCENRLSAGVWFDTPSSTAAPQSLLSTPENTRTIRNYSRPVAEGVGAVAMATYLHPLPVGLHLENDAGVGFGQSVSVRDAFTGESQLHFGQTGAAEQTQRVGR